MSDRIITIVVTIVITGILGVIGSSLAGGALITALGGATKKDLEDLEAKLPSAAPGTVPGLEAGAVVAFDLANGCPEGWLPMSDLDGRVIVSAGANRAAKYGYRDIGGEEEHTLTVEEMPRHIASVSGVLQAPDQQGTGNGSAGRHLRDVTSTPAGGNAAHNNMPPYIALYFCKKE